jgi:protein sanA
MKKLFLFAICVGIILMLPWMLISFATTGMIYMNVDDVPARKYGLLLGTSPGAQNSNLFFNTRIEAAKILYEKGKIEYIIVSGDNSTSSYNEPLYMKTELERRGVATDKIVMDYAGFRTLDSVLRAKEIFSLTDDITIISQPFHLERALFLAKFHKINAIGFGAADVSLKYGLQTYIREIGARWLAMYDTIRGTQATVLGDKVEISENAEKNISEQ